MKEFIRIYGFSKKLKKYYIIIFILSIVVAILGQVWPLLLRQVIDKIQTDSSFDSEIFLIFVFMLGAKVISNIATNVGGYYGDIMNIKLKKLLSEQYYKKLMVLPQRYFDDEHTGTIIGRLDRSIASITDFIKQLSNLFFSILVTAAISFSIIAYYVPPVAILLALLFPVYLYFTNKSSQWWQSVEKDILKNQDSANGRFAEVVSQVRVTKSFTREDSELKSYIRKFTSMIGLTHKQSKRWHLYDGYRTLSQDVVLVVTVMYIVWQAFEGRISVGEVFMLTVLAQQATLPLRFISFMIDNLQKMISSSKDYFEVMSMEPESIHSNSKKLSVGKSEITFTDVTFAYEDSQKKKVLNKISFTLDSGKKLALVGESGEGKSTITNLLMGFYQPNSGAIDIGGTNIATLKPQSLRSSIATVFQDPSLFSGTIASNIAYGNPSASQAQIRKAAKAANAHDFISDLKDGYKSQIGERGIKLSGGQKQRIAIARAILKDAPILILDEATSSLDSKSEIIVQDALNTLMKGRTTLVIAHRLSTIADVDTIITLKNGRIDEQGSPRSLAKTGGIYAQLLQLQDKSSRASKKLLTKYDIVG